MALNARQTKEKYRQRETAVMKKMMAVILLFTGINRRSDSVLTKKAIIRSGGGERVQWDSGLISVKDREGGCGRHIQ